MDGWNALDDDRCAYLQDSITQGFSRPLALAALRGKLGREGEVPPPVQAPRMRSRAVATPAAEIAAPVEPAVAPELEVVAAAPAAVPAPAAPAVLVAAAAPHRAGGSRARRTVARRYPSPRGAGGASVAPAARHRHPWRLLRP